jgi:hypothetical protein
MNKLAATILAFGALSAATAADLSKYRGFQFGMDLATVAKQAGMDPAVAKVIHSRPALLEELVWRPKPLGPSADRETVKEVVFSFYNGELYRIAASYDRYETEGMTADDLTAAISGAYGSFTQSATSAEAVPTSYGERVMVLAQWQDSQYRFILSQSLYAPEYKLVGILKRLEEPVHSANTEALRLDNQEAPLREAARRAKENDTERVRLEQARLVNKANFRP